MSCIDVSAMFSFVLPSPATTCALRSVAFARSDKSPWLLKLPEATKLPPKAVGAISFKNAWPISLSVKPAVVNAARSVSVT